MAGGVFPLNNFTRHDKLSHPPIDMYPYTLYFVTFARSKDLSDIINKNIHPTLAYEPPGKLSLLILNFLLGYIAAEMKRPIETFNNAKILIDGISKVGLSIGLFMKIFLLFFFTLLF